MQTAHDEKMRQVWNFLIERTNKNDDEKGHCKTPASRNDKVDD